MIEQKYSVRGKLIEGTIIRMKSKKTAHIEVKRTKYIPKYERYLLKKSTYAVHVPDEIDIKLGDVVLCGETRKISKTKSMIIIKKIDNPNLKETTSVKHGDENEAN